MFKFSKTRYIHYQKWARDIVIIDFPQLDHEFLPSCRVTQ